MTRTTLRRTRRRGTFATAGLTLGVVLAVAVSAAAVPAQSAAPGQTEKHLRALRDTLGTKHLWAKAAKPRHATNRKVAVHARSIRPVALDSARLRSVLARAPRERTTAARTNPLVVSLPAPNGTFHRFALVEYPIMAPGLARKHPEIKAFRGRGITDRTATIHADISPLGFHASVRSSYGAWYIDPYFVGRNPGVHVSYYGRDAKDTHGPFVERESHLAELSADKGYYHAADTVALHGGGFEESAAITITISDPTEHAPTRTLTATSDSEGSFDASFVADPDGKLDARIVDATDGEQSAHTSYQVVRDDDPTVDPPTGPELRTYRLAMITDPGYSAFFGGPANVTAAKVALMNRVNQIYEDDLTIRMQFIANNDLLNLNTYDLAVAPNGPCGSAGCYTQAQVLSCSTGAAAHRHQPDHRRLELRRRPPGARPAGRRCRAARPGRTAEQGSGLHGPRDAGRRLLRRRLRRARARPPVRRQPHLQRQPAQLLGREPQPGALGRAGQRLLRPGVRRHLRDRRPPASQRPVLLAAEPAGDDDVRRDDDVRSRSTKCRPSRSGTSAAATKCRR